jgi:hypothetical protein
MSWYISDGACTVILSKEFRYTFWADSVSVQKYRRMYDGTTINPLYTVLIDDGGCRLRDNQWESGCITRTVHVNGTLGVFSGQRIPKYTPLHHKGSTPIIADQFFSERTEWQWFSSPRFLCYTCNHMSVPNARLDINNFKRTSVDCIHHMMKGFVLFLAGARENCTWKQ